MNLSKFYDEIEPVAYRIAEMAVDMASVIPVCREAEYLISASKRMIECGKYNRGLVTTSVEMIPAHIYLTVLMNNLEGFISGRITGKQIIKMAGRDAWFKYNRSCPPTAAIARRVSEVIDSNWGAKGLCLDALEIGGGVGGTASHLHSSGWLGELDSFTFSDIKPYFFEGIEEELDGVSVRTAHFDINQPRIDNLIGHPYVNSFDVIYGTNVLHVAHNIERALESLMYMLAPGGHIVIGEGSPYGKNWPWSLDILFSIFQGWYDVPATASRPYPGFLSKQQWLQVFDRVGMNCDCYNVSASDDQDYKGREFGYVYCLSQ